MRSMVKFNTVASPPYLPKSQNRIPNRGVNWVLKIFLSKISKLKLYAQIMSLTKFYMYMLMINNK